jgi:methylthioribose-1-phosphate isomerase
MVLEAIKYKRGDLQVLDQLQLPHKTTYDQVKNSEDAWHSIHSMRVRGAPAIAIVAALGLAVELYSLSDSELDVRKYVQEKLDYLVTSRPTAVNLGAAATALRKVTSQAAQASGSSHNSIKQAYIKAAEKMLKEQRSCKERTSLSFNPLQHRFPCNCWLWHRSWCHKVSSRIWQPQTCLLY